MTAKWKAGLVVLALLGVGVWGYTRHTQSEAEEKKQDPAKAAAARVVPVAEATVVQRDVPITLDGLGNVSALTVTVRSQVDGRLDKVLFREGQTVHKGAMLAQIDPRPYQIALHQAEGALARDQAQLKNAQLNLERYKDLRARNLVAAQELDNQTALAGQAEGTVAIDRAAVESARLNLDYAKITSPIEGVTGVRLVDNGNLIRANDTTGIVMVTQLDPIFVVFTLPQDVLPQVAEQIGKGTLPVEAYARDGATHLGSGELLLIDNQVNETTATLRLKASFPNPKHLLWPNQFVKARLLVSTRKNALVVPATVVQRGPEGTFAYVIGQDETVKPRPLEVAMIQGDEAIIAKGLAAGERVVSDGQTQLRPGAKVKSRDAASADGKGREAGGGRPGVSAKPRDPQPAARPGDSPPAADAKPRDPNAPADAPPDPAATRKRSVR